MSRKGIPIGVAVIGVLSFLVGLLWLFLGVTAILDDGSEFMSLAVGAVSVMIGIAFLLFGLGCLKGWGWIWTLGVVLSIVSIVLTLFNWFRDDFSESAITSNLIAILIQLAILVYLSTNKVKAWFGKA